MGFKGAQNLYKIKPDLSTFGKAIANGFSLAAVGGKQKIMELASLKNPKKIIYFFYHLRMEQKWSL